MVSNVNKETTKAFVRLFANGTYITLIFIASRAPINLDGSNRAL